MAATSAAPVSYSAAPAVLTTPAQIGAESTDPNETLYVNNLSERVTMKALRTTLQRIFKQYGNVLGVRAYSNTRMRGQAWVIMENKEQASKAMEEVQGFPLFEKPMVVKYAANKSDRIAKRDGDDFDQHKSARIEDKNTRRPEPRPRKKSLKQKKQEREANKASNVQPAPSGPSRIGGPKKVVGIPDEYLPPNSILFVQNIPAGITAEQIQAIFQQYPMFQEIRSIPTKPDIAFIEYTDEASAGLAKDGLSNFEIQPGSKLKVTYARK